MKNLHKIYAVVDLETTGASFRKGHRIIQVGITMIQNDELIQEYNFTVNPGKAIPPLIENLTGIANKDVKSAPYFDDIAPYLHNLLEDCIFVAHNIAFDYHFLNQSFEAVGLPKMKQKGIDTVELTKILYPTLKSYRLSDLSTQFGFSHQQAHDAADDARATAQLFLRLKEKAISLPIVTLEKLCLLGVHTQRNNQEFLELCLSLSRDKKEPLSENLTIINGIALLKKPIGAEQTAYRLKNELSFEQFWQSEFLEKLKYLKRENQEEVSKVIYQFLQSSHVAQYAIEAPPGLGKTFAYLLPAILSATPSKKIILSTSTLLLQGQLEHEIEELSQALPFSFSYASLSSKSHLVQLQRFAALKVSELSNTEVLILMSLYVWLTETKSGDVTELSPSHQAGGLLERISYRNEVPSVDKKWLQEDFYQYHQMKAAQASILITNHAYLSYHFEEIGTQTGQKNAALIIDEAHRFPKAFQEREKKHFTITSMKKRMHKFAHDVRSYREYLEDHAEQSFPQYELLNLEFSLDQFFESISQLEEYLISEVVEPQHVLAAKKIAIIEALLTPEMILSGKFQRICRSLQMKMEEVSITAQRYLEQSAITKDSIFQQRIRSLQYELLEIKEIVSEIALYQQNSYHYLSYEGPLDNFQGELIKGKFEVGADLQAELEKYFNQVLYVSATLFQNGNVNYFSRKIGKTDLQAKSFSNDKLVTKRSLHILAPNDIQTIQELDQAEWIKRLSCFIIELSQKNKQKMMILFNSNKTLEGVYRKLRNYVESEKQDLDILAQGFSGSNRRMHRRFVDAERAILLGSGMYWEGIDFPDKPVEILVMTRLPFDSPQTPENQAIQRHYEAIGSNAFREEFLPRMLMRFAQGLGRISRSEGQKGILICLDNRIFHSPYAKQIQEVLPAGTKINQTSIHLIAEEIEKLNERKGETD